MFFTNVTGTESTKTRRLPAAHALAFAMATHRRLGQDCVAFLKSEMTPDVVRRIVAAACAWPQGAAAEREGVVRLLGGGLMRTSCARRLMAVVDRTEAFQPSFKAEDQDEMQQDSDGEEEEHHIDDVHQGRKERGCRCGCVRVHVLLVHNFIVDRSSAKHRRWFHAIVSGFRP
jgi:hypothetical protein